MIELDTTQMKAQPIDKIAQALLEIEHGIAALHDEFRMQPLDGPLNYWAIYDLKRHADQLRSSIASFKKHPLPPSPISTDDRIDTRNHVLDQQ